MSLAATRVRDRLSRLAAAQLNVPIGDIEFGEARVRSRSNPENAVAFSRLAAAGHWAPATIADGEEMISETVFWTPPELLPPSDTDTVNSSLCHGFIFDFCGVEIDRVTGSLRIDTYVTAHDCGRILHPGMVAGQITGGFAHALGAAIYEEYAYTDDGNFLAGTFADYLLPTCMEVVEPIILHTQSPSPFTPLGSKGVGEGNAMSTPVCVANAVADALGLAEIDLPLSPAKLAAFLHPREVKPAGRAEAPPAGAGRALRGAGHVVIPRDPQAVWTMLLDPDVLGALIPGCQGIDRGSPTQFRAEVLIGIGPVKGRYRVDIALSDLDPPHAMTLTGSAIGALGVGRGSGRIWLAEARGGTQVQYEYAAHIGGKLAAVGDRLLDGAARLLIGQFFSALRRQGNGRRLGLVGRLQAALRRRG